LQGLAFRNTNLRPILCTFFSYALALDFGFDFQIIFLDLFPTTNGYAALFFFKIYFYKKFLTARNSDRIRELFVLPFSVFFRLLNLFFFSNAFRYF